MPRPGENTLNGLTLHCKLLRIFPSRWKGEVAAVLGPVDENLGVIVDQTAPEAGRLAACCERDAGPNDSWIDDRAIVARLAVRIFLRHEELLDVAPGARRRDDADVLRR